MRRWLEAQGPLTTGLLAQQGAKLLVAPSASGWNLATVRDRAVVYPVFPDSLSVSEQGAFQNLCSRLHESFCLMGPLSWVSRAEACLSGPRFREMRTVDYDFLSRPWRGEPVPEDPQLTVARPADAGVLFPLQEGYEKEEVLFSPEEFQRVVSWLAFQKTLKEQLVVIRWNGRQPVAQARTNARFGAWAQIGGVYTVPSQRRRGLQKELLSYLLAKLSSAGQGACLFVKKENLAAVNLYYSLGFGDAVDYRISYWRKA
ncbi:MAG: GNAT family N-acetyltransferase [Spirochaetales bacterium]